MKYIFRIVLLICTLFSSKTIFALPKSQPIESELEPNGVGAIVFNTSKLPLETDNERISLFNYDIYDTNVKFLASGYWKSLITANTTMTVGSNGTSSSTPNITFSQNIDLNLWLMINNHYYFEANFADEFERNTIAAGYIGDGYLKSVRIANRGISFPNNYSISGVNKSIGGGENEAPGFSLNFAGDKWRADGTFRYDMLQAEEKTWYGKNTVITNEIELSNWKEGNQFILQDEKLLQEIEEIFIEDKNGDYKDSKGIYYKKLDKSQYLLISSKKMIVLSKDIRVSKTFSIAIQFSNTGENIFYSTLDDFLAKTQDWFDKVNLNKYYFFKNDKSKIWGNISGSKVAYIQYPTGFSPFVCAFRYDCGVSGANDATIASKFSGTTSKEYSAMILDEYTDFAEKDFFDDKHFYVDVYLTNNYDNDISSPSIRFPFAKTTPNIYFSGSNVTSDLILKIRTYTPIKRYDLGTKAIPGTVKVYKNGVLDSNARYDSESGTLELSTNVGIGDHIHATWYEENKDANTGILTGATGFEYFFTENIRSDISFATRWTLTNSFANENFQAPGFFTLAQGINYETENISFSNIIAGSFEKENTTNIYRILGMDDNKSGTIYLSQKSGFNLQKGITPILNLQNETIILDKDCDKSEKVSSGIKDSEISGYAIPILWNFEENTTGKKFWVAESIELSTLSKNLSSASNIEIAIKTLSEDNDYKVYFQLGIKASTDSNINEESEYIPTWDITDSVVGKTGWQIIPIIFNNEIRNNLSMLNYSDARIIITSESNKSGTLLFGPYEINGISFAIQADENCSVNSYQKSDYSLTNSTIKKFNESTNYVQSFDWRYSGIEQESKITAIRYFKQIDISNYSTFNFFFKTNFSEETLQIPFSSVSNDDFLSFILDNSDSEITIKLDIKKDFIKTLSNDWHSVEINLISKYLFIDGKKIANTECKLFIDTSNIPNRYKVCINPIESANNIYKIGNICIDELYLSESSPYFILQDKTKASYKKLGNILSISDFSIIKDLETSAYSNLNSTIFTNKNKSNKSNLFTNGNLKATITNLKIETEIAKSSEKTSLSAASHKITTENPIFSIFSFGEDFTFDSEGKSLSKINFAKISTRYFSTEGNISSESDFWGISQTGTLNSEVKIKNTHLSLKNKISQKINISTNEESKIKTEKYFLAWKDSTKLQIDTGNENASKREISNNAKLEHQFDFFKMKPNVNFTTTGIYKSSFSQIFTDKTSLNFELPFKIEKNTISFSWKKTTEENSNIIKGGNYKEDYKNLSEKIIEKDWYFKSIPVYDIFNEKLSKTVSKKLLSNKNDSQTLSYSSIYNLAWNRKLFATKYDFFIPNMVQASFSRDITAATNLADIYQAQLKIGTTSFNMFGKNGLVPFFNWYEQDEYITSVSAIARFPKENPKEMKYFIAGYTQATFFMTTTDFLKTGLELSFENKNTWAGKTTIIWKRIGNSFFLNSFINLIQTNYDTKKITHTRTDSLNFTVSHTSYSETTNKYEIEYSHNLDSKISKYVTINSFFTLNYNTIIEKLSTINFSTGIGCTIQF